MMKTKKIWFETGMICLQTEEGAIGKLPIKAFPRLYNATNEQRERYTFSPMGVHWADLDEDLSYDGFFFAPEHTTPNQVAHIFASLPEINVNEFARVAGINKSLMAKYICGVATPSQARVDQIKRALHRLGNELLSPTINVI